jgi:hypothetical protein
MMHPMKTTAATSSTHNCQRDGAGKKLSLARCRSSCSCSNSPKTGIVFAP